ncbi:MAG: metalloregulator ArsR/SmtB family transcription factor [Pseudomonadota bacterium]|jgi:hypothetical protein
MVRLQADGQRPSYADVNAHAGQAAQLLKALANEQRLRILCALVDGELSVGEINQRVTLSQSALSQHLALLRESGVVTTRRKAQTVWYGLAAGPARRVMQALYDAFCAPLEAPSTTV